LRHDDIQEVNFRDEHFNAPPDKNKKEKFLLKTKRSKDTLTGIADPDTLSTSKLHKTCLITTTTPIQQRESNTPKFRKKKTQEERIQRSQSELIVYAADSQNSEQTSQSLYISLSFLIQM
jgi:hypothetical protein